MKQMHTAPRKNSVRLILLAIIFAVLMVGTNLWSKSDVSANHPVLVEGEQDFDGDGRIGAAEDTDNATDRVYGTISAALLAANGAANANGNVIIVTSGRFPELIRIPNTDGGQATLNGVTIVEAAPGVLADIDAVLAGNANNGARSDAPGIVISTDATDRLVILRNLNIRNFAEGVQVNGAARVQIINCRFDSNLNFAIRATGTSRISIIDSTVFASGMRFTGAGAGTPGPGTGIRFEDMSRGLIVRSTISGNTAAGVSNASNGTVTLLQNAIFDNGSNFTGGTSASFVNITNESQIKDFEPLR